MREIIILILSAFLFFSPVFSGTGNNVEIGDAEVLLQSDGFPIRLSFEHYKMQDGWTPVVLSIGEIDSLLWMDTSGRVFELREPKTNYFEPVCFIDMSTKNLQKEHKSIYFDVYEQNNIRTRWRLSSGSIKGTMAAKILFSKKCCIEFEPGTVRLSLKYAACDFKEFSPGLYHMQFHGPSMKGHQPLIYEKASGMIYSIYEWDRRLTFKSNQSEKTGRLVSGSISPVERAALIALYNSTDGDNWTNNSGWKTPPLAGDGFALPGTENTWYGITCDPGNTTVQSISMGANNMNGFIPPELGNLANLQFLWFISNQLSGSIPPELGKLANLKWLFLGYNQIDGNIPSELGNLANLQYLSLGENNLSGSIPPELGNLVNLLEFDIDWNNISGAIIPGLGNLVKLEELFLAGNQLSGTIPNQLGKLVNLYWFFLNNNQLSGTILPELGNLSNLQILALSNNQFTGNIPPELGKLANLQHMGLNSNKLNGSIPQELGNLDSLEVFDFDSNQFSGNIPSTLINLKMLINDFSSLRWNALYTNDIILRDFLNSKQFGGNWESTQTIAPTNISAAAVSTTSIDVNWTPIIYTSDSGGYRVFYSIMQGGPYTYFGMTADKLASSLTVTGLNPGTAYYFVVQTRTYPHAENQNIVDSEYSPELPASTLNPIILISPNGSESLGLHTIRNITWTTLGVTGNIRLELWKANRKIGDIASNIPIANGNYSWHVGTFGQGIASTGNDYKVKIITANGLYSDMSNANFSIIQPSLILTSPKSNTGRQQGTQQNITWTSLGLIGNVKLLLFKDGNQIGVIARGISIADGTYTWTVGKSSSGMAPKGSNYTVKIRCEDNNFYSSGSGPFTIL